MLRYSSHLNIHGCHRFTPPAGLCSFTFLTTGRNGEGAIIPILMKWSLASVSPSRFPACGIRLGDNIANIHFSLISPTGVALMARALLSVSELARRPTACAGPCALQSRPKIEGGADLRTGRRAYTSLGILTALNQRMNTLRVSAPWRAM